MGPQIKITDYIYNLPDSRIAKYPLDKRDDSKLLIYKDGVISENTFNNISSILPNNSLIVFNNTKVVPARLFFKKLTGAIIEIFCLEPTNPTDYALSFAQTKSCEWHVVIGNAKKWKDGEIYLYVDHMPDELKYLNLRAQIVKKEHDSNIVKFLWDNDMPFSQVLDLCGSIPIPPYLNRNTEQIDLDRYQTLYAKIKGSVAAPTAGLHFTDNVLCEIKNIAGLKMNNVCLHVGAGTFLPVKSENVSDHKMHTEPFEISIELLNDIIAAKHSNNKLIAVGTTSSRCLESIYYLGINCIENGEPGVVTQWMPYNKEYNISIEESLRVLKEYMINNNIVTLSTKTSIIIVPSFEFRLVDILITNFHQPQSTLLLLISAFTNNNWKDIYNYALDNNFRFLSYGDSSILFSNKILGNK